MKSLKFLIFFVLTLLFSSSVLAGGSSAQIDEVNKGDKMLMAGQDDQLLMSFVIKTSASIPGDLMLESIDFNCSSGQGFSQLHLYSDEIVATADFEISESGQVTANFENIDFMITNGIEAEFDLRVDIESSTGDFITACNLDWVELFNLESEVNYELNRIAGNVAMNTLVYVEDAEDETGNTLINLSEQIVNETVLEPLSTNNSMLSFQLDTPETFLNQPLFVHCSGALSLKNLTLSVDDQLFDPNYRHLDVFRSYLGGETSFDQRFIFSDVDISSDSGVFEFYGEAHDRLLGSREKGPYCQLLNTETETFTVINETPPQEITKIGTNESENDLTNPPATGDFFNDTLGGLSTSNKINFEPTFSDIDETHSSFTDVEYLARKDVFKGHPDGRFGGTEKLNRAQMMILAIRLAGVEPDPEVYKDCFPDVEGWYEAAVCYGKEQEWIEGYADGEFKPADLANEAERFKILLNPLFKDQIEAQSLEDIKNVADQIHSLNSEDWFAPYVTFAVSKNIDSVPLFSGERNPYRVDVARMIFRALLIKENNLDIYHDYYRDSILREQGLEDLLVFNSNCYKLEEIRFDFYGDYLASEYGIEDISDHPAGSVHLYFDSKKVADPDDFPLFSSGPFCTLDDGGLLFSNMIVEWGDSAQFNRHLMHFDQEGNLVSDQSLDCTDAMDGFPSALWLNSGIEHPESLEMIDCKFAKDQTSVYFDYLTLDEADPDSFEPLTYPYSKDTNHVYFFTSVLEGANPDTFEVIDLEEESPEPFAYSKDDQYVFYADKRLDGLNPDTFSFFDTEEDPYHLYVKDEDHVFWRGELMNVVDPATFILLEQGYSSDDQAIYYLGQWVEEADPDTFQVTLSFLDPDEFEGSYSDFLYWHRGTAFDKNHFYRKGALSDLIDSQVDELISPFFIKKDNWIYFNYGDHMQALSSESKVLTEADMEDFVVMEEVPIYEHMWGRSDDEIYLMYVHLIEITDADNFEFIDKVYSKDSKNVFHFEISPEPGFLWVFLDIPEADPATFERMTSPESGIHLGKDANHIYYKLDTLETGDIDIETAIFVEENGEIQDGNGYGCPLDKLLEGDLSECAFG